MPAIPPDQDARRRAATEFERNVVVTAGAGTGKTALLVERFLNLLLSGAAPLDGIVAITFTEKATNEMRGRVAAGLDAILGLPVKTPPEVERSLAWLRGEAAVPEDALQARAERARTALATAAISTIHSFSAELLRRHPREAGLPLDVSVDEGADLDVLLEEMWPEFLGRELGSRAVAPEAWQRLLARHSQGDLESLARSLVRNPVAADLLLREGYRSLDPRAVFGAEVAGYAERFPDHVAALTGNTDNMRALLETAILLARRFLAEGPEGLRSAEVSEFPLRDFWERTTLFSAGKHTPGALRIEAEAEEALRLLQDLRAVDEGAFPDVIGMLRRFITDFRERALREGRLVFEDLLILARNLLRDHPEIRAREAERARFLLVDEFQDTDPLQYEIVFYLCAAGDGAIEDPYTTPLAPGKLFIVGDPKQSIYRFRGADITAFRRAAAHVRASGTGHALTANFRSVPGVLVPLNGLFGDWLTPVDAPSEEVEPGYEPLEATRLPADAPALEIWSVETDPEDKVDRRRTVEARAIARRIAEWIAAGREPGHIALLFRSLMDVPLYARALREAGIDFVVEGGRAFQQRPEVMEALALIEALANPADPVATLAVLRSTAGGATDAQVLEYARAGGRFAWNQNAGQAEALERVPRVRETFEFLRGLAREQRSLPLDRWVLAVLTEGLFPALMSAYLDGPQRVANVRKLALRLASLLRERGLPLEPAVRMLRDELEGERAQGESPLADASWNAVRISSIHKAKGLEFPIVILADLSRRTPPDPQDPRVAILRHEGRIHLALEIPRRGKLRNTAGLLAKRLRKRHEQAEEKRILYVAATRAEDRLVFVNSSTKDHGRWVKRLEEAWGYDPRNHEANGAELRGGILHRRVKDDPAPLSVAPRAAEAPARFVLALREAAEAAARERPPRFRTPSADHRAAALEAVPAAEDSGAEPLSRDIALAVGHALHRVLEGWDFRDGAALQRLLPAALEEAGREAAVDRERLAREASEVLRGFLDSPLPARLAAAEILGREIPILYRDAAGATVHGYADLVYRLHGRVRVADYKTDRDTGPARARIYREQLADYAATVQRALGLAEPPVAEVLFLRTGDVVELEAAG